MGNLFSKSRSAQDDQFLQTSNFDTQGGVRTRSFYVNKTRLRNLTTFNGEVNRDLGRGRAQQGGAAQAAEIGFHHDRA